MTFESKMKVSPGPKMKLDIIDSIEEFIPLGDEWNNLLALSAFDNPFQSHQWLVTWWQVYGKGKLHIVTCRDALSDELLGALPLYRSRWRSLIPLQALRILGSGKGNADFLGGLARQRSEAEVFGAMLEALLQDRRSWDVIELLDMDSDSPFCQFLRSASLPGIVEVQDPDKRCPYLTFPDSWEGLLKGLSRKVRQRMSHVRRSLDKNVVVVLEEVADLKELDGALADVIRLRQDRMEQKGITTAAITDAYRRFHKQLMPSLLKCGRLRLYFLCLDGQRIAYSYLFSGGSGIYFYQTGFDRNWGRQSVGFVLLSMVIEKSIADGYKTFEFLRGIERYKYEWGNVEERYLSQITLFSRKPSGKICQLMDKSINLLRYFKKCTSTMRRERKVLQ